MTHVMRKLIGWIIKRMITRRAKMALGDYFSKDEALWLPKGSVRAVIAITLIGAAIYLSIALKDLTFLGGLAGAAVGYYFSKTSKETPSGTTSGNSEEG